MANATVQDRWRFRADCFALHFIGNLALGVCPAGGGHSPVGSGDYVLLLSSDAAFDSTVTGQRNWRFCHKCRSLWFNGQPTNGVCPAGGSHSASQSGDYSLIVQDPDFDSSILAQRNWRFCSDCFVLWFNGQPTNGVCPAGGGHTRSGSGDYALTVDTDTVFN
jgi:RNA polymerase subunit RPABC4/transcription elongation factor Spt4